MNADKAKAPWVTHLRAVILSSLWPHAARHPSPAARLGAKILVYELRKQISELLVKRCQPGLRDDEASD
jgi:hypothetical protein